LHLTLKKTDRIRKRSEFITLSKLGRRVHNEHFIAVVARGEFGQCRLGVTVTRKIGNAVMRNRIKRRVRECFRLNRHQLTGIWDINIIAKKVAADLSSEQIFQSLSNLFEKVSRQVDR